MTSSTLARPGPRTDDLAVLRRGPPAHRRTPMGRNAGPGCRESVTASPSAAQASGPGGAMDPPRFERIAQASIRISGPGLVVSGIVIPVTAGRSGGQEVEPVPRGAAVRPVGEGGGARHVLNLTTSPGPAPSPSRVAATPSSAWRFWDGRSPPNKYLASFTQRRLAAGEDELLTAQPVAEGLRQRCELRNLERCSLDPPSGRTAHGVRIHRDQKPRARRDAATAPWSGPSGHRDRGRVRAEGSACPNGTPCRAPAPAARRCARIALRRCTPRRSRSREERE